MTIVSAFLAFLAHVGMAMATQTRGGIIEGEFSSDVVALAEQFRRDLGKKFNEYDDGAGCNCAKDVILDLAHAHVDALEHVPYVTLALLEDYTFDNGDAIGGLEWNPYGLYREVTCIVEALIKYSTQILVQIDCNYCGIDGTKTTTYEGPEERRELDTITPYDEISHYECCCDMFAVRKLIISRIKEMYEQHLLNPGAEVFTDMTLENLYHSTIKAIQHWTRVYLNQHKAFDVDVPDITVCGCPDRREILVEAEDIPQEDRPNTTLVDDGDVDAVGFFDPAEYIKYGPVTFGDCGNNAIFFRYSKDNDHAGTLEIRLDSVAGTVIGIFDPDTTGGWGSYDDGMVALSNEVMGTHDIFFVANSEIEDYVMNIDYFILILG